jgi:hypothetical protein
MTLVGCLGTQDLQQRALELRQDARSAYAAVSVAGVAVILVSEKHAFPLDFEIED